MAAFQVVPPGTHHGLFEPSSGPPRVGARAVGCMKERVALGADLRDVQGVSGVKLQAAWRCRVDRAAASATRARRALRLRLPQKLQGKRSDRRWGWVSESVMGASETLSCEEANTLAAARQQAAAAALRLSL